MTDPSMAGIGNQRHTSFDAVVVGAGFAGIYALYRLKRMGCNPRVFEMADGVGGTWYWNRYPGARCDVESLLYSYSFSEDLARNWTWTERYATQPEILGYLEHVVDYFDLRRDIQFSTRIVGAAFDEAAHRWNLTTEHGERVAAQFCIMATGCLSDGVVPAIDGLDAFRGERYRTSQWPRQGVNVAGKLVGVIGTGSSAIQAIPLLAETAAHLTVFQRTPNFSLPAQNTSHRADQLQDYLENFLSYRARARRGEILGAGDFSMPAHERPPSKEPALAIEPLRRREIYERRWQHGGGQFVLAFPDLMIDPQVNATAAEFIHTKIDEIVRDPKIAQSLKPTTYPLGSKRVCVDTGYYATFNRANVRLVDIKASPIQRFSESGVHTQGEYHPLDVVVFATGFDAITGTLLKMDIRGRDDVSLRTAWKAGPAAFLGVSVAGFPNLFIVTGPGSPSVLSNVVVSIEQHVEWITDCIGYLRTNGLTLIDASPSAQAAWMNNVFTVADGTLFNKGESWYRGSNIPGKPQVFPIYLGGVGTFRNISDAIAAAGYQGFVLSRPNAPVTKLANADTARALWEREQAAGGSWVGHKP